MSRNELDERIETYYVRVRGVVQGVGFRHATVREAHALKLRGWVANLEDGTVEAMIQGRRADRPDARVAAPRAAGRARDRGDVRGTQDRNASSASSSNKKRRGTIMTGYPEAGRGLMLSVMASTLFALMSVYAKLLAPLTPTSSRGACCGPRRALALIALRGRWPALVDLLRRSVRDWRLLIALPVSAALLGVQLWLFLWRAARPHARSVARLFPAAADDGARRPLLLSRTARSAAMGGGRVRGARRRA